jgi:hypothetical protein
MRSAENPWRGPGLVAPDERRTPRRFGFAR